MLHTALRTYAVREIHWNTTIPDTGRSTTLRRGPKSRVDPSPLPFHAEGPPSQQFAEFCRQYIVTPKGHGALEPFILRPWQVEMTAAILDPQLRPRRAGIMMPRGSGKSTWIAALSIFELMTGPHGASAVAVATTLEQAKLCFRSAAAMVELNPELLSRVQVFRERLEVPARHATFIAYPSESKGLQGLDFTLAIIDELGDVSRDTVSAILLAQGKRPESVAIGIGTPTMDKRSVLTDWREQARNNPDDPLFVWQEFGATEFPTHPIDCPHCWALHPAIGDFFAEDGMRSNLPPVNTEAEFRRRMLCQFVVDDNPQRVLPAGVWESLSTGEPIPDGADVVLAFDGAWNGDTTALVAVTIARKPHIDVLHVYQKPTEAPDDWHIDVLAVEQAIRNACKRFRVREILCDPARWARSLTILESEGLPVVQFDQTIQRMGTATSSFLSAALNGQLTHSGNATLTDHLNNAVLSEDSRAGRLVKASRWAPRIDTAVCAAMAVSRAQFFANRPKKKAISFP